jgi:hypothetical protein
LHDIDDLDNTLEEWKADDSDINDEDNQFDEELLTRAIEERPNYTVHELASLLKKRTCDTA